MNWQANWSQLQTILWLRWRLTRNQWARSGGLGPFLAIISAVLGIMMAVGAGVGGFLGGWLGLSAASPELLLIVWDVVCGVFLFTWSIGVLAEIQKSEMIDLGRLLHLPVSLEGIFIINYITSHLTPGIILFIPAGLGLSLGLMFGKSLWMVCLVPLVFSFAFMVTAWTYCLRGWLVSIMINPRRRRNVIMGLTMSIVLLGQAPNLYFNLYLRHQRKIHPTVQATPAVADEHKDINLPAGYVPAHRYIPLLWLPGGAYSLGSGSVLPAVAGTLGGLVLGLAGLARAYQSTVRFYRGGNSSQSTSQPVAAPKKSTGAAKPILVERELAFLPREVAAMSLAFLRSILRAPEIKMSLGVNVIILIVLAGAVLSGQKAAPNEIVKLFLGTGGVAFTFFGLLQMLFNQFGYDRDAFRAIILLPASRQQVLLGKNLALAPLILVLGVPLLALLMVVVHLPFFGLVAALLQLVSMFLLVNLAGNAISILVPYRISAGTLKPTKPPAKTVFLIMLCHLTFPLLVAPIFIPPAAAAGLSLWLHFPAPLTDAVLSVGLLAVSILAYWLCLPPLGRLLERREQKIMLVVSQEVE